VYSILEIIHRHWLNYIYMLQIYRPIHDKNRNILQPLLWGKYLDYKILKTRFTRHYLDLQLSNGMGCRGTYWHSTAIIVVTKLCF
jgi:hypothetical protein